MPRQVALFLACVLTACSEPSTQQEVSLEPVTVTAITGGIVNRAVEPVPVVRAVTAGGTPVAGELVSFTVRGGGFIGRREVRTREDGSATPGHWVLGEFAGETNVLTATLRERPGQVEFTATSAPGPVMRVLASNGDEQLGRAGDALPLRLTIRAEDEFHNGVPGVPVMFEVIEGGGSIEGGTTSTDLRGHATSGTWSLGADGGLQRVRAIAAGLTLIFTASGCGPVAQGLTFITDDRLHEIDPRTCLKQTLRSTGMAPARKLAWSPDGRRLAFEVIEDRRYNIYLATLDDWKPERRAVHFARPAWSPEGKTLAASTGHCIYTCETLTLNTDQPYTDPEHLVWDGWSPAYSPDGSRIAYVRMSGDDGYHSLHVMNADGSDDRYVTGGEGPAFDYPSWAPDGTRIAFASCTADGCRLMVVGSNGSGLREVLPGASILSPTWSPDGRWIAFSWIRDQHDWEVEGIATIAYVSPNGGTPAVVGYGRNPAWRVR